MSHLLQDIRFAFRRSSKVHAVADWLDLSRDRRCVSGMQIAALAPAARHNPVDRKKELRTE